jgi:ribosomal protein L24E
MTNGEVNYFCSSKCRKNMQLGKRKVRWLPKDIKFNPKGKVKVKK